MNALVMDMMTIRDTKAMAMDMTTTRDTRAMDMEAMVMISTKDTRAMEAMDTMTITRDIRAMDMEAMDMTTTTKATRAIVTAIMIIIDKACESLGFDNIYFKYSYDKIFSSSIFYLGLQLQSVY